MTLEEFYDTVPLKTALRIFVSEVEPSFRFNPDVVVYDNGVGCLAGSTKYGRVCKVDSYDEAQISVWVKPKVEEGGSQDEEDTNIV